jgi:HAD superfamily hydrolase (TIGR01509 family)
MWNFTVTLPHTSSFDAILFDCDGTLIDSMPLHWHAWRAALQAQQAPFDFSWDDHHAAAGRSIPETVSDFNQRYGTSIDPDQVEHDRMSFFFAHLDELRLIDPVTDIARRLRGQLPLGIGSGSHRTVVMRELDHFQITDWFSAIVTASDVPRSKPDPDIWLTAAATLGVPPERCLVIEDGEKGLIAARAAGMSTLYVPTNEHHHQLGLTHHPSAPE